MTASTIPVATAVLSNLSSFVPALAVRTVALLMVVWMTREQPASRERRLAITALSLLLASKVFQTCAAGVTTWLFASNHDLMFDLTALRLGQVLGIYLPLLLESVCLLVLAWVMVQVLRVQVLRRP